MTSFVPELLAKVTAILGFALLAVLLLRVASPALRHSVLAAALGSSLALPVLMLLSPDWRVAMLPARNSAPSVARSATTPADQAATGLTPRAALPGTPAIVMSTDNAAVAPAVRDSRAASAAQGPRLSQISEAVEPGALLPLAWLLGCLAVLGWLVLGRTRLNHISRTAWSLTEADWTRILGEECDAAGVKKRVRLLASPAVSTPLTWGWRSPIVLLPEDALDWSEPHRRIVLRHELAHVARADSLAQLVGGIACAIYWFHPLVWIAERRMRAECERACDDSVLSLGTPPTEYATHLLEVARSARAFGAAGFLSVAMARPSQLEGRLLAVLNESRRRGSASTAARFIGALIVILLVLPTAAFRPVARSANTAVIAPLITVHATVEAATPASAPAPELPRVGSAVAARKAVDSTFRLSVPAKNGGTLILDLSTGGSVVVTSWDRPEVAVRASLRGRDWRKTKVTLTPENGDARLESYYSGAGNTQSSSNVFEITVPRSYDVRLSSAGGSVSLTGLDGTFTGHTGGGEIDIRNSSGEAQLKTGGGRIHVVDSRLNGTVSTGGGVVTIERVSGDFQGRTGGGTVTVNGRQRGNGGGAGVASASGSPGVSASTPNGSVSATSSGKTTTTYVKDGAGRTTVEGGAITMTSAGGALTLPRAPDGARVTTGGGAIRIGASDGDIYASTGGGPVDIGPARGSVSAHTGAGDVTIELEGASGHEVNVTSGNGQVVLVVPKDLDAVLELETAYTNNLGHKTRIVSDVPLQVTETANWDDRQGTPRRYVRARQAVGRGGAVIRVRTVNGDVIVRRKS